MPLETFGWNAHWQRTFETNAAPGLVPGRVLSQHRSHLQIAIPEGEISAEIPGRLWNAAALPTDLPGVGDYVALTLGHEDDPAFIEAVLPRRGALIRQAAGERRPQLIAANIDVVFIVTALDGDFSLPRIERYVAMVRDGGAEPVIVINKADIAEGLAAALAELDRIEPNVQAHVISARNRADLSLLEPHFIGNKTIALVGSSGVGKSTLTNQLLGREAQVTQTVSTHDNRGRHTTTHRELFARPGGGVIMDTPGMGGLTLWADDTEPDQDEATDGEFTDIETLAANCKFRNCAHASEPACAVQAAVAAGELDADRLDRYRASL